MIVEIPLFVDTPRYTMNVALSSVAFKMQFDYNGREDRWYFSIYETDGTPIRTGRKVVPGVPPLARCRLDSRPAGVLFFSGSTPPRFAELGRTVRFFYDDGAA